MNSFFFIYLIIYSGNCEKFDALSHPLKVSYILPPFSLTFFTCSIILFGIIAIFLQFKKVCQKFLIFPLYLNKFSGIESKLIHSSNVFSKFTIISKQILWYFFYTCTIAKCCSKIFCIYIIFK